MKLYFYYALHSVKNQIKKLFRSWVAIVIVFCIAFGLLVGLGASLLESAYGQKEAEPAAQEEIAAETGENADESKLSFSVEGANMRSVTGLAITIFSLGLLLYFAWRADRSGSDIFLMPDVNLLFAAPMKPQSVLLFRLMSQIFLYVFIGFYMGFQLPNLTLNMGLPIGAAIMMILAWIFLLLYCQLVSLFVYTVTSTHERFKKYITPAVLGVAGVIGAVYFVYYRISGLAPLVAADKLFNSTVYCWIPIVGWIKGLIFFAWDGKWGFAALCGGLLILGLVLLFWGIWQIKADFYEDAMVRAQIRDEKMKAAKASSFGFAKQRTKERSEKTERDRLFGSGAQMFFTKAIYNRIRFGILKVFSKTSLTYLSLSILGCAFILLGIRPATPSSAFPVLGFLFCGIAFFRAMGDPLAADMEKVYFTTVPASAHAKVFWSLLGGTTVCAMDLLPAVAVAAVLLRASVVDAVAYFLLAVVMDYYVSNVLLLIDLTVPTSVTKEVRQVISVLFIYFGMVPPIAVVAILGIFLPKFFLAVFGGAIAMLLVSLIFFAISPLILERGRK